MVRSGYLIIEFPSWSAHNRIVDTACQIAAGDNVSECDPPLSAEERDLVAALEPVVSDERLVFEDFGSDEYHGPNKEVMFHASFELLRKPVNSESLIASIVQKFNRAEFPTCVQSYLEI